MAGVGPNSKIIGNVRILEKFLGHFDKHQKSSLHTNFECVGECLIQNMHDTSWNFVEGRNYIIFNVRIVLFSFEGKETKSFILNTVLGIPYEQYSFVSVDVMLNILHYLRKSIS